MERLCSKFREQIGVKQSYRHKEFLRPSSLLSSQYFLEITFLCCSSNNIFGGSQFYDPLQITFQGYHKILPFLRGGLRNFMIHSHTDYVLLIGFVHLFGRRYKSLGLYSLLPLGIYYQWFASIYFPFSHVINPFINAFTLC